MDRKSEIRIGFDFDGVLAYNPLRIFRGPANLYLKTVAHKEVLTYYPRQSYAQLFWKIIHRFSLIPGKGFDRLCSLMREGQLEAYLITGRYAMLDKDLHQWLQKHAAEELFSGIYVNKANEPPHLFKQRLIGKLKLEYFVEDNWDIVQYLNQKQQKCEIHWIYNILDRHLEYPHKHPNLGAFLDASIVYPINL